METQYAIIIGAGPAGLTAASELLKRTDIVPIVLEATGEIGGISKTVNYKGNRIDIGGHRFFSKSERVMQWWQSVLPVQGQPARDDRALQRAVPVSDAPDAPDPEVDDAVMLVRNRLSRIFYRRHFFNYPLSLNLSLVRQLGLWTMMKIGLSYLWARLRPIKPERSLEDFFINRFGRELYSTFFRDYTAKVWGRPCSQIKPDWGAQRVKGLNVSRLLWHALRNLVRGKKKDQSVDQKGTETSLIEQFLYPKHGPGQMWETVAEQVRSKGGEVRLHREVVGLHHDGTRVTGVVVRDTQSGEEETLRGAYVFSTMPMRDLLLGMRDGVPGNVKEIAEGLIYRDFMTVGLLLKELRIRNETAIPTMNGLIPDNWIYIQENDVKVGRLQLFNNWSPYMVADPETVWIGLEYFCNEGDALWSMDDDAFAEFCIEEMSRIDMIRPEDVLDHTVIRMPKTYPCYFGTYDRMDEVRSFTDSLENLFLIGRNGMHRYNNQDHSMLTAMTAVDAIVTGERSKDAVWQVNEEEDYHEEKEQS